jgi:hypothetical protein
MLPNMCGSQNEEFHLSNTHIAHMIKTVETLLDET